MFQSVFLIIMSLFPLLMTGYLYYFSTFISFEISLFSFFSMNISLSVLMDWISMMFLFTVMFISSMILMFSMEYIYPLEHKRFSILLLLFILSMSLLILSDNIILILLGWDGLGLTSFILVIYYQNASSSASGSITIFSNRLGDIFMILSIAILTSLCSWNFTLNNNFPKIVMVLMLLAACSKSAQFPFSAWLPAAMAAPTPISALVHSSTLVTAGVYLLIRIMDSPHPFTMISILMISSMTAIYASMSAIWEMDLKKIIALSTLSQIAMMMFAISLGSTSMAFFHLIIHALFKSMMFLCAGILIHHFSYQDMRNMGTNLNNSPLILTIMGIASMALMGIPFMSGFFSKDPIIELVISYKNISLISLLMIFSIGMTSTYSIRMIHMAMKFYIKSKPDIMISPYNFMEIPILMMAPLSILMGSMMMWISSPEQTLIIPNNFKFYILMILFSGLLTGTSLLYLSKKYKKLGQTSISLWFIHFLSVIPSLFILKFIIHLMKNDKTWQELYGPSYSYLYSSSISSKMDVMTTQLMFIIMMMMIYPLLIISM